jgi:hypothetical protein
MVSASQSDKRQACAGTRSAPSPVLELGKGVSDAFAIAFHAL